MLRWHAAHAQRVHCYGRQLGPGRTSAFGQQQTLRSGGTEAENGRGRRPRTRSIEILRLLGDNEEEEKVGKQSVWKVERAELGKILC